MNCAISTGVMSRYAGVLSVNPMTQVAIYQQEQTALIHQMSQDLSGKLSDNIAEAVNRAVEPLNQNLKNFVTVSSREQMRFLDAVVTRFIERMDEMLGGQMCRLSKAMDDAARYQESAMTSVRDRLEDTSEMLDRIREVTHIADEMVRNNAQYIRDLREKQKQADGAFARVASSVEQMNLINRQQANYIKSVSAMQAEVSRSLDQMNTALTSFTQEVGEQGVGATASLSKAAAELRATGSQLEEIHRGCAASNTNELKLTLEAQARLNGCALSLRPTVSGANWAKARPTAPSLRKMRY